MRPEKRAHDRQPVRTPREAGPDVSLRDPKAVDKKSRPILSVRRIVGLARRRLPMFRAGQV